MGIELLRHTLVEGTTVEFYDCAGQVDYAGMHQTFVSRRALYLLVWDVRRCDGTDGNALDKVGGPWQQVAFVVAATLLDSRLSCRAPFPASEQPARCERALFSS